jgi:phosphinothricin acetyltransferase
MKVSGGVRIRHATIEDLPAIVAIYNSTILGRLATADLEPVPVESRVEWFHAHRPERHPLDVAEADGRIVGWVSLQPLYGRPAYAATAEVSVYVHETVRRQGVGQALLFHIMELCPSLGISTLLGFIFGHNTPSLRLFAKNGFETWARLPRVARLDDVERDLHILGRRLSDTR